MPGALPSSNPAELETKTFSVTSLLDGIRKGRFRIPRFQRGFRWDDEDRRQLLDSLQLGYPVGTLLLARGEAPADSVMLGSATFQVPATNDALWVVDGQQRLSALAMSLLEEHLGTYRPIFFDLEQNKFVLGVRRRAPPPHWLPTHVLASSSSLNRWLRDAGVPDALSDRADDIAQRIREYIIPAYVVPYDGHDDSVLKRIFERTNRRGRALESHEVFEALHTGVGGEKGPIDRVRKDLAQLGFGLIEKVDVERSALAVLGGDPGKSLHEQAPGAPEEISALFERVSSSLGLTIEFLAEDAGVPHVELLPYSGALFTLARFFSRHPRPHPRNRDLLSRWFWRGTLNEDHRTNYTVDRRRWRAIDDDEHRSVQRLLSLLPAVAEKDLATELLKPYRRSTARANTELLAMYSLGPRLLTGEDRGQQVSIAALVGSKGLSPCQLVEPLSTEGRTSALLLLHPSVSPDALKAEPPSPELLKTHGIDMIAFQALLEGNIAEFIERRSEALARHLRTFLRERTALHAPDKDRAPIDAYFEDESA